MHRQSTIDLPLKNVFKRTVSKESDGKSHHNKGDNGKMVKNIYRQPISRCKTSITSDRSMLGETRRRHFAGAHLNQIWSSDPRDFRSHAGANRSDDGESSRSGRTSSPKSPRNLSSRRSSSVPDVPFILAPGSPKSPPNISEKKSPSKNRNQDEAQFIFYEKDLKKKMHSALPLCKANSSGGGELRPVSPSAASESPRSPLLRMLYKKSRHLSHDPDIFQRSDFGHSLDFSDVERSFSEHLQVSDEVGRAPTSPKEEQKVKTKEPREKQSVILKNCDFELYDLAEPSSRYKKGLRITIELEDVFVGCKTTVKAMSGGNTVMVVVNSSMDSSCESVVKKECVERVDLPVTVDSFGLKAKCLRPGQLIIEAPVRHMRSTSEEAEQHP